MRIKYDSGTEITCPSKPLVKIEMFEKCKRWQANRLYFWEMHQDENMSHNLRIQTII